MSSAAPQPASGPAPRPVAESEIEFRDVRHHYTTDGGSSVAALSTVDLEIPRGQFVCVVGPSGCGKTTLLKMIAGFLTPTEGTVLANGDRVQGPAAGRGVVFQNANLYPWFSVLDNVALGLRIRGMGKAERRERASHFLETVGLQDFADSRPYELSGGMQQRAQIARVLATDPDIILMDEPFGALDAITRDKLQADLLEIHRSQHKTIFFITHDVDEAVFLGNRVLVMSPRPGRILLDEVIDLESVLGRPPGKEMRAMPQFVALRERISGAIQAS
ncbi:ABC transporter ATP-binding protein [Brachybacterium kimchii]|uniref:ABC transporter ATP-binding protein n=1 Tax=Brachybacterium kimchii TaxID=2942909 RepID=A0ABY4N0L4_9MICO|nr:ABC transporter ATP-binding protein [Brachybacterium kimchii]UQN28097.1 ABC transporter ATP-binding protein [Brachybacterium kimchii]